MDMQMEWEMDLEMDFDVEEEVLSEDATTVVPSGTGVIEDDRELERCEKKQSPSGETNARSVSRMQGSGPMFPEINWLVCGCEGHRLARPVEGWCTIQWRKDKDVFNRGVFARLRTAFSTRDSVFCCAVQRDLNPGYMYLLLLRLGKRSDGGPRVIWHDEFSALMGCSLRPKAGRKRKRGGRVDTSSTDTALPEVGLVYACREYERNLFAWWLARSCESNRIVVWPEDSPMVDILCNEIFDDRWRRFLRPPEPLWED